MVVAGVVVVLAPTLTTLGAVWSKQGNCLRAIPVLDPPFQLRTPTHTFTTTRVCSGSRERFLGNCLRASPVFLSLGLAPPVLFLVVPLANRP